MLDFIKSLFGVELAKYMLSPIYLCVLYESEMICTICSEITLVSM